MKYSFILFISFSIIFSVNAQPGTLDYTFADSGKVIFFSYGTSNAVGVLSTGKIVTAGNGSAGDKDFGYEVVCYNEDGSFNKAFGKNGFTILKDELQYGEPYALSILPNDFIITAGGANSDIVLVKLKPNGTLDSTFGENGIAITDLGEAEYIRSIQIQTDGKIVVAGESYHYPDKAMLVARYSDNGILDESFGDKGKVILHEQTTANSVALQKDGKIVVGGLYFDGSNSFLLVRLNSDGSYDESFGNNGIVITDFSDQEEHGDYINSVAIQPDGKILAAGISGINIFNQKDIMSVARYDEQGNLDNSFGTKGKATVKFSTLSEAITILLQSDGKIILSGETRSDKIVNSNTALCRLNKDGSIDSSFATNGLSETDFGGEENATSAVLQKDGKIVITGNSYINNGYYDILARYNNNDKTQKQIIITKIRHWNQHHNGFTWDNNNNTSIYVIQRSYDGIHFSSIAKINAGNSSNYTYADPSTLNGTNYYRLQTTSVNGAVNYSNIIAVSNDEDAIKISPNPANNNLHIEGLSSPNTKFTVVDFSGNVAISQQLKANSNSSYNLNIASLHSGNYLLKIESGENIITKKFVKE